MIVIHKPIVLKLLSILKADFFKKALIWNTKYMSYLVENIIPGTQ